MKKTTNKFQDAYMIAKAYLETLEAQEREADHQYIIDHGIKNPDGSIPECIYCIEDEETFDRANAEQAAITEKSGLWNQILSARAGLEIAEEKLIQYGLSIAPEHEREVLMKAVKEDYTVRMKVINLVLNLDVSTVK